MVDYAEINEAMERIRLEVRRKILDEGAAAEHARIVACLVAFAESAEEVGKTEWGIIYRSAAEAIADGAADCIERGDHAPPASRSDPALSHNTLSGK